MQYISVTVLLKFSLLLLLQSMKHKQPQYMLRKFQLPLPSVEAHKWLPKENLLYKHTHSMWQAASKWQMANGKQQTANASQAVSRYEWATNDNTKWQVLPKHENPIEVEISANEMKNSTRCSCKQASTSKCTNKHTNERTYEHTNDCTSVQRRCCMQQAMCHKGTADWAYGTRLAAIACCMPLAYLADAEAASSKWRLAHSRLANVTLLARPAAAWLPNRPYAHSNVSPGQSAKCNMFLTFICAMPFFIFILWLLLYAFFVFIWLQVPNNFIVF